MNKCDTCNHAIPANGTSIDVMASFTRYDENSEPIKTMDPINKGLISEGDDYLVICTECQDAFAIAYEQFVNQIRRG